MEIHFIQLLSILAIFQACFVSFQLWGHKHNGSDRNRILALYIFILALHNFTAFTVTDSMQQHFRPYHKMIYLSNQTAFLIGPLLYYYFKLNILNNYKFRKQNLLHFAPFVIYLMIYAILVLPKMDFNIWYYKPRHFNAISILTHNMIYVFIIIHLLRKHKIAKKRIKRILSLLLVNFFVLWSIQLNTLILFKFFRIYQYYPVLTSLYAICAFVYINIIAYNASKKTGLYYSSAKQNHVPMAPDRMKYYQGKIQTLMTREKPYLDPSLSLMDLAKKIAIPHRHLSHVINEAFNKNFYDLINMYRIKEVKQLMDDQSRPTKKIIEIAYEVGFNSKSSFNMAFKKFTGMTPKEYKKGSNRSKQSN